MQDLKNQDLKYDESSIKTLNWKEHIRKRPGMYIGKLGDGKSRDDGIYILVKEVIDNSIDEFRVGKGKKIIIKTEDNRVSIRDYGRGIPLGRVIDVSSKMNTGAKYDSKVFKKSVGLNGVGIKAVNALSSYFKISSFREGVCRSATFSQGVLTDDKQESTEEENGTQIIFTPDKEIFFNYSFIDEYIESMMEIYSFLNRGLEIIFNNKSIKSDQGLKDLLESKMGKEGLYPIIHIEDDDIELAMTHGTQSGEEYYSFVNGQHTTQGGTHLQAFRESLAKTIRDFYNKNYDISDIKTSLIAAFSIKIEEPVFESQTKTKLGSKYLIPPDKEGKSNSLSIRQFVMEFMQNKLNNYLLKNKETADILNKKIVSNEKERKEIAGVKKKAKERANKISLHNKKLRDCKVHYDDNHERRKDSTIFITEGDSASGSITKSRDVNTQAVFSLKGKPLNSYGKKKNTVYSNEEFNLLQAALNIEENIENLRYNNIVIATDADVDGMHIRLLMITFFLNFFPEVIRSGHLYILQTPLFRVRDKKQNFYCYNEEEKNNAIKKCRKDCEITRFKGLGEISPNEFKHFIGRDIRLEPVIIDKNSDIDKILSFYMGDNTPKRQEFIINKLRVEEDRVG